MTTSTEQLKPCPFCGGVPTRRKVRLDERFAYAERVTYSCEPCGFSLGASGDTSKGGYADNSKVEAMALAAWNRAAHQPENTMPTTQQTEAGRPSNAIGLANQLNDLLHDWTVACLAADELRRLDAENQRLAAELDEADRRAGAAERQKSHSDEAAHARSRWLSNAKAQWGVGNNVSFDVVWNEALSIKAERDKLRVQIERLQGGEPLFWYRPCSNGLYEGPLHNKTIEDVRKRSGAWVPLYAAPLVQLKLPTPFGYLGPSMLRMPPMGCSTTFMGDRLQGRGSDEEPVFTLSQIRFACATSGLGQPAGGEG